MLRFFYCINRLISRLEVKKNLNPEVGLRFYMAIKNSLLQLIEHYPNHNLMGSTLVLSNASVAVVE